ncbi:MAG: response regulator transcription factor [Phycisphaerales bacterium]
MSSSTVLVVEDDAPIRRGVVDALAYAGFRTVEAADGPAALHVMDATPVDLVLLDVMLPRGVSGFDLLRTIRARSSTLPVIMLTARGGEGDRVEGLTSGADDYVVKPFSARELLARVDAVLRRSPQRQVAAAGLRCGGLEIRFARREARAGTDGAIELTAREASILSHLAEHHGRAIHRDELLRVAWGLDPRGLETRTVDMQMVRLREKLAPHEVIGTVRGLGYKLADGVEVVAR